MQPISAPVRPRRDPAPSRWSYRWQRLWLTPSFRRLVRMGLPVVVLVALVGAVLGTEGRRMAIAGAYADLRGQFQNRPEFMVNLLTVEGASGLLAEAIRADLALELPLSSFEIDLDERRRAVEAFDAVARAELRILSGGILQVSVVERLPAMVWRSPDGLWLIDAEGNRVARIGARGMRADLPLIAGAGANLAAGEAQELLAAAAPLGDRLRGLVRMGERRWDVVLDRGQRLKLPAEAPVRALERTIALHQAGGLLDRDMVSVDLRLDRRPTLRLSAGAADTLRRQRLAETGG